MLCIPNCAMAMDFEMSKAKYYHTFNEVEIYYYLLSVKNERNGWKQYRIAVYEKNNDMPANSCTYIVSGLKKANEPILFAVDNYDDLGYARYSFPLQEIEWIDANFSDRCVYLPALIKNIEDEYVQKPYIAPKKNIDICAEYKYVMDTGKVKLFVHPVSYIAKNLERGQMFLCEVYEQVNDDPLKSRIMSYKWYYTDSGRIFFYYTKLRSLSGDVANSVPSLLEIYPNGNLSLDSEESKKNKKIFCVLQKLEEYFDKSKQDQE